MKFENVSRSCNLPFGKLVSIIKQSLWKSLLLLLKPKKFDSRRIKLFGFQELKWYKNDVFLHEYLVNETFPCFPPTYFARRKAREILIYRIFVQKQVILIFLFFSAFIAFCLSASSRNAHLLIEVINMLNLKYGWYLIFKGHYFKMYTFLYSRSNFFGTFCISCNSG